MLDWRPESVAGVTIFSVVDVCESVCVWMEQERMSRWQGVGSYVIKHEDVGQDLKNGLSLKEMSSEE